MATPKKQAPTTGTAKTKTAPRTSAAKTKAAAKPGTKAAATTEPLPTEQAATKAAAKPAAKAPAKAAAKPAAKAPAKAAAKPAAKAPAKAAAKPAAKAPAQAAAKPAAKAPAKAAAKPAAKAPAKAAAKPAAKPAAEAPAQAAAKPAAKAPAQAAAKPEKKPASPKPAAQESPKPAGKSTAKATSKSKKSSKDTLTPEEKARVVKLRATLALLKADSEWPAFLEQQRQALLKLRDELLPNMQNVTRDHLRSGASNVSSSSGQHIGDAGSEAEVRDLTIRLLDKDREQLFEIDAALERIRRGYYGICEISLDPIPKKRLQVRPFCRLTVKCQEEYEKKYGSYANYKARNNDRVGYAGLQNDIENAISLDDDEN
ncbi:MAG: TraR/DksA family transcriptional regulator [Akkermansia sp.]